MVLDASTLSVSLTVRAGGTALYCEVSALPGLADRADVYAWSLGPDSPKARGLGNRLRLAILAGKVFAPGAVLRDVNGRTYLSAASRVMGRRLNADLRRLGF